MSENNEELEKGKQLLKDQVEEAGYLDNAFKSIAANMAQAFEEVIDGMQGVDEIGAKIAKSYERDIVGSIKKMSSSLDKNIDLQLKMNKGQNVSKEIEDRIQKVKTRALLTSEKISRAEGLSTEQKLKLRSELTEQYKLEMKMLKALEDQNKENQQNKSFSQVFSENLKDAANKLDKTGTLAAILGGNLKEFLNPVKILELAFAVISTSVLAANKSITGIQKELGVGSLKALGMRMELSAAAFAAEDLRVTTENLIKANSTLNSQFQTAAVFNKDILVGATKFLDAQIMSGEATSQLAGDAARLGMTFEEAAKTQEDSVNAINAQTGAQISLKTVLEASNKVTGQIRAQLGANPEAIARAVTKAKALGFELEQIAASGKQLLDFESSISNELEAELLTGKQLNLEKARLAALTGDYETLTEEIAKNVGDFNDFSSMNVLQQEAIAKSVGMTADELANSLITEENRAQLLQDAIASGNEQSIQQLQALDAQEKFAKAVEQVKGLFVDIFQIFSPIVDFIALAADGMNTMFGKGVMFLGVLAGIVKAAKAMKALEIGAAIGAIFKGNAKLGPVGIGLSIAAVAAMIGAINKYAKADDFMSQGYGDRVLYEKGQIPIAFNNNDNIFAGTELGKVSPISTTSLAADASAASTTIPNPTNNTVDSNIKTRNNETVMLDTPKPTPTIITTQEAAPTRESKEDKNINIKVEPQRYDGFKASSQQAEGGIFSRTAKYDTKIS